MQTVQKLISGLWALLLLSALPQGIIFAQETMQRVDLFAPDGQRQGYIRVDPEAGRIEIFDQRSSRIGWGKIQPDGQVEVFDPKGNRLASGRVKQ